MLPLISCLQSKKVNLPGTLSISIRHFLPVRIHIVRQYDLRVKIERNDNQPLLFASGYVS